VSHQNRDEIDIETLATQRLTQRVLQVCEAVGTFIEWWGFKDIHGRIWVLLSLSTRPLSQREIADILDVSRSLVSTAVAELHGFRLVRPVSEHRNAPYRASMDVWSTISEILRTREWMILERVRLALEAAVQECEQVNRSGQPLPYSLPRIRLLLRMTELAQMMLRTLIALGSARIPRSLTSWIKKAVALTQDLRSNG